MAQLTIQQAFDQASQHQSAGRFKEAQQLYRYILSQSPRHAGAMHYLGVVAYQMGRSDEAVELIRRAIVFNPQYAEAHNNLGLVLKTCGQTDAAIAAFRQAIAIRPTYAHAHYNLAFALNGNGQPDEAIAAYRQAIAVAPNFAEAYSNLGNCLRDVGLLDEAIAAYRQAVALAPTSAGLHSNLLLTLHYHPHFDAAAIAEEHRLWHRRHAQPLAQEIRPFSNDRDPERRLRVGYVSPDFREHVVGRFLLPLLANHDRSQVKVFAYANIRAADAMTDRLRAHTDTWHQIGTLSDAQVADFIRQDRIDLLVDLAAHTSLGRLLVFARKPAPVQITWLAYPGSTGMHAIDYRLSDPYLDPTDADQSLYPEKTIRLPDTFWCFDPLDGSGVAVGDLPALQNGFVTFGCLNNFCKINQDVLTLWAQVMRHTANSRLLLLAPPGGHRQRTIDRLGREGIEPERVDFLPLQSRKTYLETYNRIDIGLDTFPYNGHTTSLDSFWMGVPVITLIGQTPVSRAGLCQLSNLGLQELAAHTPGQFEQIAVDLAGDLAELKVLRSTLRQRIQQSPLMDAPRFARNVEAAYRQMWRDWCAAAC